MAHDPDPFAPWEAGQTLMARVFLAGAARIAGAYEMEVPEMVIDAVGSVLAEASRDPAFAAECLQLPAESHLAECMEVADPESISQARREFKQAIARRYRTRLEGAFRHFSTTGPYSPDAASAGDRRSSRIPSRSIAATPAATSVSSGPERRDRRSTIARRHDADPLVPPTLQPRPSSRRSSVVCGYRPVRSKRSASYAVRAVGSDSMR